MNAQGSRSVVRSIMLAFRVNDSGSNPGGSTSHYMLLRIDAINVVSMGDPQYAHIFILPS